MNAHRIRSSIAWEQQERALTLSPETATRAQAEAWDRALSAAASPAPLTQSWAWGTVQGSAGWQPERLRLADGPPVLVLTQRSGLSRWGFVPRGPVACDRDTLQRLIDWAHENGLARLRVEPETGSEIAPLLSALGFRRTDDVQPSHTRILRLDRDEAMLASFRRTTRYNIRLAERSGVLVEEGADAEQLARHVAASATRAGVNLPGREYLRTLLETLPGSRTFVARHEGESLCALLVAIHDRRGYYLFSGSSGHKRNLKPMELAMWAGIRYAAAAGCRDYDLWGVPPDDDPAHPWHGFGEFKRGFGGETVEYAGAWDLVLSARANLVVVAHERARRAARRLRR